MIWSLGSTDILNCRHSFNEPPICQQQSWRLLGLHHQAAEWQLEGAEVVEHNSGDGTSYYSLSLATSEGEVKLPYYLGDRDKAYQDLEQFVQLIETSSWQSLDLKRSYNFFYNIMVFWVVSPVVFAFSGFCAHLYIKYCKGGKNSRMGRTQRQIKS